MLRKDIGITKMITGIMVVILAIIVLWVIMSDNPNKPNTKTVTGVIESAGKLFDQ